MFDRYCQGHQLELYVMIRVPIARIIVGGIVLGAVVSACDRTPRQGTQTADPTGVRESVHPSDSGASDESLDSCPITWY